MNTVLLIGRILFALMFVSGGLNHLTKSEAMTGYAGFKKVPAAKLSVLISGVLLTAGGLSVILGVYADLGALVLAVLLILMALKMHDFGLKLMRKQSKMKPSHSSRTFRWPAVH